MTNTKIIYIYGVPELHTNILHFKKKIRINSGSKLFGFRDGC